MSSCSTSAGMGGMLWVPADGCRAIGSCAAGSAAADGAGEDSSWAKGP